jgi:hypothetical protein
MSFSTNYHYFSEDITPIHELDISGFILCDIRIGREIMAVAL